MFLAWNEIRHDKLRYTLIIGVMFLIAYLVFFLTGLAYGLAQEYRMAIDKWDADGIVLASEANDNLNMSMLTLATQDKIKDAETASLGETAGVITTDDSKEKIDTTIFGIEKDEFIMPNLTEGRAFSKTGEAVVDSSLKEEDSIELGDTLHLSGSDEDLTVVGFTDNARFSVAPVLYVSTDTYQKIRFEQSDTSENARVNAFIVKGNLDDVTLDSDDLELTDIESFIYALPGYRAQVLTFGFMIGFLIVIAAIVIGIFIYVLTIQKQNIFGVMKAQGISSRYIANSVLLQTFLLAFIGVTIGLLATIGTSLVLPAAVPFQVNWLFFMGITASMLVVAILGAFFSVRSVTKIDPLKAIG
ncbi:MAG: ABC transporter permease [Enterococcus sp.]